ncbi:MAG: acyl-CoA dehydrogenase, partial [Alphaproteobacteria bacterium]
GVKSYVLDGMSASLLVVAARLPDGELARFTVPADAAGVARRPLRAMDPTRKLARIDFDQAQATLLGGGAGGADAN